MASHSFARHVDANAVALLRASAKVSFPMMAITGVVSFAPFFVVGFRILDHVSPGLAPTPTLFAQALLGIAGWIVVAAVAEVASSWSACQLLEGRVATFSGLWSACFRYTPQALTAKAVTLVATTVGLALLLIPGAIIGASLSLWIPAYIIRNHRLLSALQLSIDMSHDFRLPILKYLGVRWLIACSLLALLLLTTAYFSTTLVDAFVGRYWVHLIFGTSLFAIFSVFIALARGLLGVLPVAIFLERSSLNSREVTASQFT